MKTTLLLITITCLSLISFSQTWDETIKAVAADREAQDLFGHTVAISGDFAIIGSIQEDEDASGTNSLTDAGSVYIFENVSGTWTEVQKLVASDRTAEDNFGWSVDISGDYAIVGCPWENHNTAGIDSLSKAGSAYIFKNNGGAWSEVQKIVASDRAANAWFGMSVSISQDYAVVGAQQEGYDASGANYLDGSGASYIFENNSGTWTETQKLISSDREEDDGFGSSVAISGDYVVISAEYEEDDLTGGNTMTFAGAVYIFKNNAGTWSEVQKVVASDREPGDYFGISIDISGDYMIVGTYQEDHDENGGNFIDNAGAAYIFENNSGTWVETQKIIASDRGEDDKFGYSVSIAGDYAIVGANREDHNIVGLDSLYNAGAAYIFHNQSGNWLEVQKVVNSDREKLDNFGYSVSIDGENAIVSAYSEDDDIMGMNNLSNAGSAYFFSLNCSSIDAATSISDLTITASNGSATYQWLDCDNAYSPIAGETSQSYTATSNGNYAVEVSQNGCADTSDCVAITTVGLDDLKNTYGVHVYPNPASGLINIQSNQKIETVRLLDISGQLIKQTKAKNMAISELNPGVYLVQVTTSNGVVTKRIVKQ